MLMLLQAQRVLHFSASFCIVHKLLVTNTLTFPAIDGLTGLQGERRDSYGLSSDGFIGDSL